MKKSNGFTLIEVMIVVALLGLLAAIAMPNYAAYVTRSKIPGATSTLSDMRVKMEQHFQDNRDYTNACVANAVAPPPPTNNPNFAFTCTNLGPTTYTLTADGDAAGKSGMTGFVFTINESNVKSTTLSQTAGKASAGWTGGGGCWVTSKGGC